MQYEVEVKFRLASVDEVIERLGAIGVFLAEPIEQRDAYFNHPTHDFAQTDEAFRIRSVGDENRLTYKGPKVDEQTKTRQEIEVPIEAGETARLQMSAMLTSLGFRAVRTVIKHRRSGHLEREGRSFEVALDELPTVGHFLELETLADESDWQLKRDELLALADQLQLSAADIERRAYLELLLESDDSAAPS